MLGYEFYFNNPTLKRAKYFETNDYKFANITENKFKELWKFMIGHHNKNSIYLFPGKSINYNKNSFSYLAYKYMNGNYNIFVKDCIEMQNNNTLPMLKHIVYLNIDLTVDLIVEDKTSPLFYYVEELNLYHDLKCHLDNKHYILSKLPDFQNGDILTELACLISNSELLYLLIDVYNVDCNKLIFSYELIENKDMELYKYIISNMSNCNFIDQLSILPFYHCYLEKDNLFESIELLFNLCPDIDIDMEYNGTTFRIQLEDKTDDLLRLNCLINTFFYK